VEQETPSQNHDPNPDLDMGCAYRPPTRRSLFALDLETSIVTMGRRSAGSFIHQQMAAYLVRMAHSAQGSLQQLARTLAAPLRRRLDNASLARRIFDIDPLPPVAPGTIYAVSDPEFVGRMPVRTELTVLTADEVAPTSASGTASCVSARGLPQRANAFFASVPHLLPGVLVRSTSGIISPPSPSPYLVHAKILGIQWGYRAICPHRSNVRSSSSKCPLLEKGTLESKVDSRNLCGISPPLVPL
jgi:hypothetical protein